MTSGSSDPPRCRSRRRRPPRQATGREGDGAKEGDGAERQTADGAVAPDAAGDQDDGAADQDDELEILRLLERGEIDVAEADRRLDAREATDA